MLTHSHYRFASHDLRANGVKAPSPRLRRLAGRASQILVGALITTGLLSGSPAIRPALATLQSPIGYERWTNPDANSDVDFGLTTEQVFQKYAASLNLAGLQPTHAPKDKRLIDIEVRDDGSGLANYVYDVVWVKDEGEFRLDSWFVPGMKEDELLMLPELGPLGMVAVDLERFPVGGEWRYSVILQRNAGKFGWQILTDVPWEQVESTADHQGLRLLDLDYAVPGPDSCPVQGQACSEATFDAILVANSGSNSIETKSWFNMTAADIAAKQAQGYQMIDREDAVALAATIWVKPGLPFDLHDNLSENEVIFEHGHHGRVVDLEHTSTSYAIVNFAGSAAPASPRLADAQQGDNDGRHHAKHRDDKAKGKTRHDRKSEGNKSGKRGKHGKGKHRR
jgi:hypothetical protein